MELNTILAWFVGLSSLLGLAVYAWRRLWGWATVSAGLGLLLGLGLWQRPQDGAILAFGAWLLWVALPLWASRRANRLASQQNYGAAQRWSTLAAWLHPMDGWLMQPHFLRALRKVQGGDLQQAKELLNKLGRSEVRGDALKHFATLQLMRLEKRWGPLCDFVEREVGMKNLLRNPQGLALYVRALGETGRLEELLRTYDRLMRTRGTESVRLLLTLFAAGYTGRVALVDTLLEGPLAHVAPALRTFWRATAHGAAGNPSYAKEVLKTLNTESDPFLAVGFIERLSNPLPPFDSNSLSPESREILARLDRSIPEQLPYLLIGSVRRRPLVVTPLFVLINVVVFLLEIPGGSTSESNLVRMGALIVPTSLVHNPWQRIFSAGFLHYGPEHLLGNVISLWILGRYMEQVWGRWAITATLLGSMFGANALALMIMKGTLIRPTIAAGASGGVMGLLGAAMAFIAVEWIRTRIPVLKHQWLVFLGLLSLQIVFDLVTPQISSTIHLCGLGLGASIGTLMALARPKKTSRASPDLSREKGLAS